jgi:hypothetical protein
VKAATDPRGRQVYTVWVTDRVPTLSAWAVPSSERVIPALLPMVALVVLCPLVACAQSAPSHITVAREVLLESGNTSIEPYGMIRTSDGRYVIVGRDFKQPWATQVDAQGNVVWRYEYPTTSNIPDSQYNDAVQLPDGTVLLCGTLRLNPTQEGPVLVGLFTRIDGHGKVVSQTQTSAEPSSSSHLDHVDRCAASANGVIAVGHSSRHLRVPPRADPIELEDSYWLISLDDAGAIRWQKKVLVPYSAAMHTSLTSGLRALIPLNDGYFVVVSEEKTASRFSAEGELKNSGEMEIPVLPTSLAGTTETNLGSIHQRGNPDVTTLDRQLKVISSTRAVHSEGLYRNFVFVLPDGALSVFGSLESANGAYTAAVGWIAPHSERVESLVFRPSYGSPWIGAVVPTSVAGEFATARMLIPHAERSGVMLAFISFQ